MFTGLVEEVGRVIGLKAEGNAFLLSIEAPKSAAISQIGDSIAINGCCLTAVRIDNGQIEFHLLQETLRCTNLGDLAPESLVNCETSLTVGEHMGGHFVQGHIDTTATVLSTSFSGSDFCLETEIPPGFAHYLISKGSIAFNGASLTVAELKDRSFIVWIIPHTLEHTNLGSLEVGQRVNLEFDLLAKYVERMSIACCTDSK